VIAGSADLTQRLAIEVTNLASNPISWAVRPRLPGLRP